MSYPLIRSLLFKLDPETSHNFSLSALSFAQKLGVIKEKTLIHTANAEKNVMGLRFPSPVGLAAGLDKNGDYIKAMAALGFGFIEIGTITPRPQPGNPKPRLFRLPEKNAIINRMGFNNKGVDHLVEQVKQADFQGILGVNIGKNADTPIENAVDDYLICLRKVYEYASYITINISSPNTKNLRQLQQASEFKPLLAALKNEQTELAQRFNKYVPLVVKIAPDLTDEDVDLIADVLLELNMDGVIATNTTISREDVKDLPHGNETGGLSGSPVFEQSTKVVKQLHTRLAGKIPIIAAGGIMNVADAKAKMAAGASLLQVYTGFIYKGPGLISELNRANL